MGCEKDAGNGCDKCETLFLDSFFFQAEDGIRDTEL